jgi:putative ABC transport system ATP-binding protein
MGLLDELHRSGRTVVLITHDSDVAEASGRVMRIFDGQIDEVAPVAASTAGVEAP